MNYVRIIGEDEMIDEEPLSFTVVLRNSHLDNKCHGAVSLPMLSLYCVVYNYLHY